MPQLLVDEGFCVQANYGMYSENASAANPSIIRESWIILGANINQVDENILELVPSGCRPNINALEIIIKEYLREKVDLNLAAEITGLSLSQFIVEANSYSNKIRNIESLHLLEKTLSFSPSLHIKSIDLSEKELERIYADE
jgi:predicted HTH domain antitoxin